MSEEVQEAPTRWPSGSVDLLRDVMVAWGGWLGEQTPTNTEGARDEYALDLADFERRVRQDERGNVAVRREVLINTLTHHWPTATSGCQCGWARLGHSYPEHVALMYEAAAALRGARP